MEIFLVFLLSGLHDCEVGSSHTHDFYSTHGGENRGTRFTRTWLVQRPYCDYGRKVVLLHYPQSSSSQSPEGLGSVLLLVIGPRLGAINFAPE